MLLAIPQLRPSPRRTSAACRRFQKRIGPLATQPNLSAAWMLERAHAITVARAQCAAPAGFAPANAEPPPAVLGMACAPIQLLGSALGPSIHSVSLAPTGMPNAHKRLGEAAAWFAEVFPFWHHSELLIIKNILCECPSWVFLIYNVFGLRHCINVFLMHCRCWAWLCMSGVLARPVQCSLDGLLSTAATNASFGAHTHTRTHAHTHTLSFDWTSVTLEPNDHEARRFGGLQVVAAIFGSLLWRPLLPPLKEPRLGARGGALVLFI